MRLASVISARSRDNEKMYRISGTPLYTGKKIKELIKSCIFGERLNYTLFLLGGVKIHEFSGDHNLPGRCIIPTPPLG